MQAMDITKNNDSGILSLGGFAYQIRVFVYYMSKMASNMQIEFETLEDVVVKNSNVDIFLDTHSDKFRSLLKKESSYNAIQVKRTNIDNDTKQKILYNWLLLEARDAHVDKYILFTDDAYKNTDNLFDSTVVELFTTITKSNKKGNALVSKVKEIYENDFYKFNEAYNKIKDTYSFISEKSLDNKIINGFAAIFHKEGITELIYGLRIKELIQFITYNILTTIDKKIPYIFTYKEMLQKAEDICDRIKDNYFEPDYTVFRKINKINLSSQIPVNSREYKQLTACKLTMKRIEEHLIYHQYYKSIKYRYLEDNKMNVVENIERTTYDNFCDVKEYLEQNNMDKPSNRLSKTKERNNCYTARDQTRFGSCIHLTMDSTDDDLKISWEDES